MPSVAELIFVGLGWISCLGHSSIAHFNCDCAQISVGESLSTVKLRLSHQYETTDSQAAMSDIIESNDERSTRLIFTLKDHPNDWCVVYPNEKGMVRRRVIAPD